MNKLQLVVISMLIKSVFEHFRTVLQGSVLMRLRCDGQGWKKSWLKIKIKKIKILLFKSDFFYLNQIS